MRIAAMGLVHRQHHDQGGPEDALEMKTTLEGYIIKVKVGNI